MNIQRENLVSNVKSEYAKLRLRHQNKRSENEMIPLAAARANKHPTLMEWLYAT